MKKRHLFYQTKRILSAVLALSFVLPLCVFSSYATIMNNDSSNDVLETEKTYSDAYVSTEIQSRRGEFEKHYLLSDGSFAAISYPEAVHYQSNGEWQEVDNTLVEDSSSSRIENSYDAFKVTFGKTGCNDDLVRITNNGETLSWSLGIEKNSNQTEQSFNLMDGVVVDNYENPEITNTIIGKSINDKEVGSINKYSGKIRYSRLFADYPEINVEYTVFHNKIEEDIFINGPTDAQSFLISLNSSEFDTVVNDDNTVDFVNKFGEKRYHLGVPYMEDAQGNVLNNLSVRVFHRNDKCIISYTPDSTWLTSSERAYPILFDPSITTSEYCSNIDDTYVYEGNSDNHSSEQKLYFGIRYGNIYRSYLKINNLPSIDATMPIISATLNLTITSGSTTGRVVELAKASSSWNSSSITYSNQPVYSPNNFIGTAPFDSASMQYSFIVSSDIRNIYDEFSSATNYGYVIKYADESKTNPDYNAVYSAEYTTNSCRPILTVIYGYSLPSGLTTNKKYALCNCGSYSYMTVHNGIDSNSTNVYQKEFDDFSDLTSSNFFKLEYVPSTGGYYMRAMCSSSGTNRVLDIVKNNGYVSDGCNVQIYNPVDSLAQHWFVICTGTLEFKIVPRTNMSLALTAYPSWDDGTSSGTSSSSPGNIFVATYDDTNDYQKWVILDEYEQYAVGGTPSLDNDIYYFNNSYYGQYLQKQSYYSEEPTAASGLLSAIGNTIRWRITYVGGKEYLIQPIADLSRYLCIYNGSVSFCSTPYSDNFPNSYLWTISFAYGGGMLIKSVATNEYLSENNNEIVLSELASIGSSAYKKSVWRTASTSYYGNNSSYERQEMSSQTSIQNIEKSPGSTTSITINKYYSNELWVTISDFVFSLDTPGIASISNGSIVINNVLGGTKVEARHKVTNRAITFYVLSGFSTTISSTPLAEHIIAGLAQPYNVWPAAAESMYYGYTNDERIYYLEDTVDRALAIIIGGTLIGYPTAANMLDHYICNEGTVYTVGLKQMISQSTTAQNNRSNDINALMKAVEASATYSQAVIRTMAAIPHTVSESTDWGYSIGSYTTSITCIYRKISNNEYHMEVTYELHDVYDWDRNMTTMGNLPVAPNEMWELHHGGYGKNYEVYGQNSFVFDWEAGDNFSQGVMTYES